MSRFSTRRRSPGHPICTSPVQTHVDVADLAGRGNEAAEAILAQVLKPAWQAKGLI
jgi:hypothetical protein